MRHEDEPVVDDREQPWAGQERRRGPRRVNADGTVDLERRQGDRRKRSPGLAGLLRAILGYDDVRR
jgi:hypothetical protein